MRFNGNGSAKVLLGGGEVMLSPRETRELFSLLDLLRKQGRGSPEFVLGWLQRKPRRLTPLVASALRERGYEAGCVLCARGAGERRYSVASARRLFGVSVHHQQLVEHRRHAKTRRPYHPEMGRPASVPAPWERSDEEDADE
jgi:hypothetical protein